MVKVNLNSILFLYEGETEIEFYKQLFKIYLPPRRIRIHHSKLKGNHNINKKVKKKIKRYLIEKQKLNRISVLIACDREGLRDKEPLLNINLLRKEFVTKNSRITNVHNIIATQDIESWFFKDLNGIYNYLKAPKSKRRTRKFCNSEQLNNRDLSKLFHQHKSHYQKGSKAGRFLKSLDINLIYDQTPELKEAIALISKLL